MLDFISEMFAVSVTFQKAWDPDHLRYGLFSNLARSAHCDGKFLQYSMKTRFQSDYLSTCGSGCRELAQQFKGPVSTAYAVNKMDHTQMVVFASNTSIPAQGIDADNPNKNAKIFLAFRGTHGLDIVNFRRNIYAAFWPVSLCDACEAHKGFWRNFVSLRPEVWPAVQRAIFSEGVEDVGNLMTSGMSMGGPLAMLTAYHLFLVRVPTKGAVVFGCPRFANFRLASSIIGSLSVADTVKGIGFAYLRDLVCHVPPRMIGYFAAQNELYHILIDPSAWVQEVMTADYNLVNYLKYDKGYINTASDFSGDAEFAASTYTFAISDHGNYFNIGVVGYSCGAMSDDFISNINAAELFFI